MDTVRNDQMPKVVLNAEKGRRDAEKTTYSLRTPRAPRFNYAGSGQPAAMLGEQLVGLLGGDAQEVLKEVGQGVTAIKIIEQSLPRHAGADKARRTLTISGSTAMTLGFIPSPYSVTCSSQGSVRPEPDAAATSVSAVWLIFGLEDSPYQSRRNLRPVIVKSNAAHPISTPVRMWISPMSSAPRSTSTDTP